MVFVDMNGDSWLRERERERGREGEREGEGERERERERGGGGGGGGEGWREGVRERRDRVERGREGGRERESSVPCVRGWRMPSGCWWERNQVSMEWQSRICYRSPRPVSRRHLPARPAGRCRQQMAACSFLT